MKINTLNHIKKEVMNMSCEDVTELNQFILLGKQNKKGGEGSANSITHVIQPPIKLSPRMVQITEKNMSDCFKTKTKPKWKTDQEFILSNIRRNY
jgi:hypothetical protein